MVNRATKLSHFFLSLDKEYIARLKLGVVTDTFDVEGNIVEVRKVNNLSLKKVRKIVNRLKGELEQIPPVYSAVKYRGKPSYSYARKGKKIDLKPRKVKIYSINIISIEDDILTIKVNCSSGTYIRSLAYEIGNSLGFGAAVGSLIRTGVGRYRIKDSVKLKDIISMDEKNISLDSKIDEKSFIISIEKIFKDKPHLFIKNDYIKRIINGSSVFGYMLDEDMIRKNIFLRKDEIINVKDYHNSLLAIHKTFDKVCLNNIFNRDIKLTKNIVILK